MITPKMWAISRWNWQTRYIMKGMMKGRWKGNNHPWFTHESNMPYRSYALIQQGKWYAQR